MRHSSPSTRPFVFSVVIRSGERAIEQSVGNLAKFDSLTPGPGFRDLDRLLHPKQQTRESSRQATGRYGR
jgi:hypothetical protein